jgi:hypothetical protein
MKLLIYPILFTIILALIIFWGNDTLISDFFNKTENWNNDDDNKWNNLEDVKAKTKEFDLV